MPVDADTKKFLEEVKKGKPRRFAMVCKGTNILSLVVYKKGSLEKYRKQAKEAGNGQFYFGVVTGKGMDITFNLASSDGFDSAPGRDTVLREFLKTEADLKCQPGYAIVNQLPDVPDEDEGAAAAPSVSSQPSASAAPSVSSETSSSADELALKLTESLKKIKPLIEDVIARVPDSKPIFQNKLTEVVSQIKQKELDSAKANLAELARLVKTYSVERPANQAATGDDEASKFQALSQSLAPQLQDAIRMDATRGAKLSAIWELANQQFVSGNAASAWNALEKLGSTLATILSQRGSPSTTDSGSDVNTNDESTMGVVPWSLAPNFEDLWQQAKSRWEDITEAINGQLERLRSSLLASNDADLKSIAEFGLNAITANHRVPLQAAMMDIDRNQGDAKIKAIERAHDAVLEFQQHIETDERIDACDNNPFGVQVTLRANLSVGLADLERSLDEALA